MKTPGGFLRLLAAVALTLGSLSAGAIPKAAEDADAPVTEGAALSVPRTLPRPAAQPTVRKAPTAVKSAKSAKLAKSANSARPAKSAKSATPAKPARTRATLQAPRRKG